MKEARGTIAGRRAQEGPGLLEAAAVRRVSEGITRAPTSQLTGHAAITSATRPLPKPKRSRRSITTSDWLPLK